MRIARDKLKYCFDYMKDHYGQDIIDIEEWVRQRDLFLSITCLKNIKDKGR